MNETMTMRPASAMSRVYFRHAPDVLDAVRIRQAEIAVQPVAHVVAVEQIGVLAERMQPFLRRGSQSSTRPCRERPVSHNTAGLCPFSAARDDLFTSSACQ